MDTGEGGRQAAPLIDPDTGIPIDTASDKDDDVHVDDDANPNEMSTMKRPDQLTIEEKKVYLMTCEAVFLDDLIEESETGDEDDAEAKAFSDQFDIETKTEEISQLLEKYPGTLQTTFSNLSDQVEYSDFWKRFFFRLSDERVEATYEAYYAIFVEKNAAAKKTGSSALKNVTNFLGGVVHRLVEENDIDDIDNEDDEETEDDNNVVGAAATSAMNFLAGVGSRSGRPPFVLNTAVSDDDDDGEDEGKVAAKLEASDDDEELGWDDDDDDDDDDDLQDEEIEAGEEEEEETMEFKDAEKERLQEELQQAREERDMLHKTVEMQAEEIKNLKVATQPDIVTGGDESKQVELLQMQLFEKESELAALRSQVEDLMQEKEENKTDEPAEPQNTQNAEVERLNGIVGELQAQICRLETAAGKATDLQAELERFKAESDFLQSQLTSLQQASQDASSEENQAIQTKLDEKVSEIGKLQQDLSMIQEKVHASTDQNEALKEELKSAQMAVEVARKEADSLRTTLVSYEGIISQLRADLQHSQDMSKIRDSEDSDSTGVKVSSSVDETPEVSPPAPVVTKIDADAGRAAGGDDDGWGDDW
jgi:DNA repair exonuclease SbcCD ATPase subunit